MSEVYGEAVEAALGRAEDAKRRRAEERDEARRRRELFARLSRDEDYVTFLRMVLEDLCAFEFGTGELKPFTQGIRAAATRIMSIAGSTPEGAETVGRLAREHFLAGAIPAARDEGEESDE